MISCDLGKMRLVDLYLSGRAGLSSSATSPLSFHPSKLRFNTFSVLNYPRCVAPFTFFFGGLFCIQEEYKNFELPILSFSNK